jgi:hypothetical protein
MSDCLHCDIHEMLEVHLQAEHVDLAIDAQHLGHLFRKVGIELFQVVSHFVRNPPLMTTFMESVV